ncbi:MAG: hypothetical protein V4556_00430 [Bacteroidota bacterium]
MKILVVLFAVCFSVNAFAQTERIAHRSHSGKATTYKITGKDNWGLPSYTKEKMQKTDSNTVVDKPKKKFHCKKCKLKATQKVPKTKK